MKGKTMNTHKRKFISIAILVSLLVPAVITGQRQDTRTQTTAGKPATIKSVTTRATRRRPPARRLSLLGVMGGGSVANAVAGAGQTNDRPAPPSIEPQYVEGQVLIQLKADLELSILCYEECFPNQSLRVDSD